MSTLAATAPLLRARPGFRLFLAGQTVSLLGDQVSAVALPLTALLALHAGAGTMGALAAVGLAPNLLLALHLGAFVDRRGRRRRAMIAADLGRALLLASVPAAWALGALTAAQLFAIAFAAGTLTVLHGVARETLFVALVPRGRYVEAGALLEGGRALAQVGGPGLGGLLVQALAAPAALLADAISFLASAVCLARVDAAEPPPEPPAAGRLAAGLRFLAGEPLLRALLCALATLNLFVCAFGALFLLYAVRTLGVAPATLGLALGAGSLGGLAGAAAAGPVARRIGTGRTFLAGSIAFPLPLALVPLAHGGAPAVLACLVAAQAGSGFGLVVLDTAGGALRAALVPDALRARVAGAHTLVNKGVRPLGALAGGALGATVGVRPTLWLAVAGASLAFCWLVPQRARLKATPA